MKHHGPASHDPENGPGYETADARPRPLIYAGIAIFGTMIFAFFGVRELLMSLEHEEPATAPTARPEVTQEPKRETNPFMDVYSQKERLRQSEAEALSQYTYDKKTGAVAIPIDRAIALIVERGVPKGKGPKTLVEVIGREEATKEAARKAEAQKGETKKDETKKDEAKTDAAKKDEGKREK